MISLRAMRRFLSLPGSGRRRLLFALLLLTVVRIGLWTAPFKRVHAALDRVAHPRPGAPDPTPGDADQIAWAVKAAARFVPAASCLTQALAAEVLLARAGHPAQIRLGAAKDERGRVEAHAWVESYGRVVLGGEELERFVVLRSSASPPAPAAP